MYVPKATIFDFFKCHSLQLNGLKKEFLHVHISEII
jgi:hypothetical protein